MKPWTGFPALGDDVFVKPKAGLKVRQPNGQHLPETGRDVPESQYWVRRLAAGDVVLVKPIPNAEVEP